MPEKRILPLGFIDRTTGDGAIIMLTRPSESHTIWPETPVTLQSRSAGEPRATASARGLITLVGYVTATCKIVETRMDSGWPQDEPVWAGTILTSGSIPDMNAAVRRSFPAAYYTDGADSTIALVTGASGMQQTTARGILTAADAWPRPAGVGLTVT